jgi:hypothetical protein
VLAYEYRVTQAADGTFPVELWSLHGGRENLIYRTRGFRTRELAEAWIASAQVRSNDPRVIDLKPRRSRAEIRERQ